MKRQAGFSTLYLMGGLGLALTITGFGLYKQVQANGTLQANNAQLEQDVETANEARRAAEQERKRVEVITLDNLTVREEIEVEREVIRDRIVEVVRNVEPENCLVQPVDLDILRMLRDPDGNSTGTGEDVSTSAITPRLPQTTVYRGNLWRPGAVHF